MTFEEEAKEAAIEEAKRHKSNGGQLSVGAVVISELDYGNKHAIAALARASGRPEDEIRLDVVKNMREARRAGRWPLHSEWLDPAALQRRVFHGGHSNHIERWLAEPLEAERFRLVMLCQGRRTFAIVGLDGFWSSAYDA